MAASPEERLHVVDTLLETVSNDDSSVCNSVRTVTEEVGGVSMDLEGFYEQGDTQFEEEEDSLDARAAGGNPTKDNECSESASDGHQQQHRSRALETTSGMPKGRWERRGDADEEGSSLGLSEMRLASISQDAPALEEDWRLSGSKLPASETLSTTSTTSARWMSGTAKLPRSGKRKGGRAGGNLSPASTMSFPLSVENCRGPGDEDAEVMDQESGFNSGKGKGRAAEEMGAVAMPSVLACTTAEHPKERASPQVRTAPDPTRWMKRRIPASKGGRGSACGAANDVLDDSEIPPKAPVSSQNILAIGVPVGRRVPGPQPRDPAPNAPDDRFEIEEGAEQEEVEEGLASTPSAINTQDIHPGNSSQVLKDCSQQRRKTDRDLDEAIAAAQADIFAAGEVAGGVCPSSARSSRPPFHQQEPVQDSHAPVTPECLLAFDHGSRAHASKTGKRKEMRHSVPAATPTTQVEGTPVGNGWRGRAVSRTPGSYLGTSTSKTSVKLKKTLLSSPIDGAKHPAKDIFDIPSEEEGEGAKITAATTPRAKKKRNVTEGGAIKSIQKEGRNGSPPGTCDPCARSATGRLPGSKKRDGGRVDGGASGKVGRKSPREGTGSGNKPLLKGEVSRESIARNLYSKLWPDLQEQGWRWVKGKGLVTHVWLKDGVAKREAKRGINLFESIEEVVEHVLGVEALEGPPSDEAGSRCADADAWQRFKIVKGTPVLEAGGVTNLRSKRKRFQRNFLGGTPVEVSCTDDGAPSAKANFKGAAAENGGDQTPKRPPTAPVSKRQRTVRDDFSRRKLRDGACDEQLDAMAKNESFVAGEEDEDDNGDIPTQPQFELATAINMIDAGRSRDAEKLRAHGVTVGATMAAAAEVVEGADSSAVIPSGAELLLAVRAVNSPQGALEECRGTAASCPTAARGRVRAGDASPIVSSPGSAAGSSRRGNSPAVGLVSRASSARRPLAGVGFMVTGIRSERQKIESSIKTLGGTVVDVFDSKSPENAEWVQRLLRQESGGGGGGTRPPRPDGGPWMIAVSAPDGDRLAKVQVALAARMPIVHPAYVTACVKLGKDVGVSLYLLPFGRSALGDNGLVMPKYSEGSDGGGVTLSLMSRDRPFFGKKILFYAGEGEMSSGPKVDTWEFTLRVAGAKVSTVVQGGKGRKPERGATALARAGTCCIEAALDLIKRGQVDFVIGPNNCRSLASRRLDAAAREAGTMAGTVEWAAQCLIHARLLVPHAGTCPWFPMVATGEAGGDFVDGGEVVGGKGKQRKGCARGGGSGGSGCKGGAFHVLSGTRRYVVGDYASVKVSKGKAAELPRVVRLKSFHRGRDGKVAIVATEMERCVGRPEVLVEAAPVLFPDGALDSRVLVMSQQQILATQVYSLSDEGILCRDDEAS